MMKIDNVMMCTVPGQVDLAIEGVRVIPVDLKDKVRNLYNLCIKESRKQTKTDCNQKFYKVWTYIYMIIVFLLLCINPLITEWKC